jgi:2-polyprenyl-6-methoxyphenol hydroxylase-like FAD-dependent oxidoreductase
MVLESASPLDQLLIRRNGSEVRLLLPESYALSRSQLDASLIQQAIAAGAAFLPQTLAQGISVAHDDHAQISLRHDGEQFTVRTELVIACDGIRGHLLDTYRQCQWHIAEGSWIGVACTLEGVRPFITPGTIAMHLGNGGYVGAVILEDGSFHLAAALSPVACRAAGGPASLMLSILRSCGVTDCPPLEGRSLLGTPPLTRRRAILGAPRILAAGDACSYIEPFTGEGIAWALQSAEQLVALLPPSLEEWPVDLPEVWTRRHHHLLGGHQRRCRAIRYLLHHPWTSDAAVRLAAAIPSIPSRLVDQVNHPVVMPPTVSTASMEA